MTFWTGYATWRRFNVNVIETFRRGDYWLDDDDLNTARRCEVLTDQHWSTTVGSSGWYIMTSTEVQLWSSQSGRGQHPLKYSCRVLRVVEANTFWSTVVEFSGWYRLINIVRKVSASNTESVREQKVTQKSLASHGFQISTLHHLVVLALHLFILK